MKGLQIVSPENNKDAAFQSFHLPAQGLKSLLHLRIPRGEKNVTTDVRFDAHLDLINATEVKQENVHSATLQGSDLIILSKLNRIFNKVRCSLGKNADNILYCPLFQ